MAPSGVTVLFGGARSGKSDLAVSFGEAWTGDVIFVATAEAGDADMAGRIDRHRADRPNEWSTVELPLLAAADIASLDDRALLLVDCVTMLVANLLFAAEGAERVSDDEIVAQVAALIERLGRRSGPSLVISNEVGMGVHPPTDLGRRYRDLLGRANRAAVAGADGAALVVAGTVLPLERPIIEPWGPADR